MAKRRLRTTHNSRVHAGRLLLYPLTLVLAPIMVIALGAIPAAHAQTSATQPAAGQSALPLGFGSLNLGMRWDDLPSEQSFVELTRLTSDWERLVYECGYRRAQSSSGDARLLVTAEDFVVTQLSYVTNIEPGSDLTQVAQAIIDNYGQPQQATMRDALGAVTIDPSKATYVTLKFTGETQTQFVISGHPLWEYQIRIDDADMRRAQNRTLRCARAKEKQRRKQPNN